MNATLADCVLVIGDGKDDTGHLYGILSTQDIVKNFFLLSTDNRFDRPVRTLLTGAPSLLPMAEASRAHAVMVSNGFQPVALFQPGPAPAQMGGLSGTIEGVISIRSLAADLGPSGSPVASPAAPKVIQLQTADFEFELQVRKVADLLKKLGCEFTLVTEKGVKKEANRFVILDLDEAPIMAWVSVITPFSAKVNEPQMPLVLAFNPAKYETNVGENLKGIASRIKGITVLPKPLDLVQLLTILSS
jgi:hypothetical protein